MYIIIWPREHKEIKVKSNGGIRQTATKRKLQQQQHYIIVIAAIIALFVRQMVRRNIIAEKGSENRAIPIIIVQIIVSSFCSL